MFTTLEYLLSQLDTTGPTTTGQFGGYRLNSHFQPIYSLSHLRLIGHEALMRAQNTERQAVSPLAVFESCPDEDAQTRCDQISSMVHLSNYQRQDRSGEWLFVNLSPASFMRLATEQRTYSIDRIVNQFGVPTESLVLEVLEAQTTDTGAFEQAVRHCRQAGALIAIDDFGAGHSNFDRVWRLQPDIVKLDRSLVARGAREPRIQRVIAQMASLLHECGSMVLMEGIETEDEALLALDCDADLVQGYYYGRPQPALMPKRHAPDSLLKGLQDLSAHRERQRQANHERTAPYTKAIWHAGVMLGASRSLEQACRSFLSLPNAEACYVLDAKGYQIGTSLWSPSAQAPDTQNATNPLLDGQGACWARRHYFRRAMEHVSQPQITRPYRSMLGSHQCVTASMAYRCQDEQGNTVWRVICGDIRWD